MDRLGPLTEPSKHVLVKRHQNFAKSTCHRLISGLRGSSHWPISKSAIKTPGNTEFSMLLCAFGQPARALPVILSSPLEPENSNDYVSARPDFVCQ